MEWREQSAVSCDDAYAEAQRWIEAVTKKNFGRNDFRSELENGVLLCDLINTIKPGIIKRVNRLPTPIAGLDNLNVFLKACGKLGLKEAQLFHPGDLQDLSTRVTVKHQETNRRLKNVLITIYWLGRRAQCDPFYNGPYLNFKAFEGLLGTALYKALQESASQKGSNIRDSGFGDSWYSEREELYPLRGGGGGGHRRDDSLDSLDSLGSRPHSVSSDATLKGSSEGCCSDTETDAVFRMSENKDQISYRRSVVITPKTTTQFNQFLPTKDKSSGYVPAPLRKKRAERNEESRRSWASSPYSEDEGPLTSETRLSPDCYDACRAAQSASAATHPQWQYDSGSDSDLDRPDPDVVLDDLASRRFHSPSPAPPANFAVPVSPSAGGGRSGSRSKVTMSPSVLPQQNVTCCSSGVKRGGEQSRQRGSVRVDHRGAVSTHSLFREDVDSEDEDDEVGYADPIQDDLYARKMGVKPQPAGNVSYDKFLPKFWTPEEDIHLQKIKLGSQRRPWYKKMQGFSHTKSGSSSDDSDCDISPWLSSAPSPSGPSPSHSHTREASAHTTLVVGKRLHQEQESFDGSKSTSDILEEPIAVRQVRYEELQKFREQVKQSEDKWQDDLSKWKNRRRSVNSDIVKKKEERETIEQVTYGNRRRSKTFKEMQEERETKGIRRLGSLSYLDDDEDVFSRPAISPRTRTLPARSYTIDTSYYSPDSSEAEPRTASQATGRASSPHTVDSPAGSDTPPSITPRSRSSLHSSPSPAAPRSAPRSTNKTEETTTTVSSSSSLQQVPEPKQPPSGARTAVVVPSSSSLSKQQPQLNSVEPKSAAAPLQKTQVSEHSSTTKKEEPPASVSSSSPLQKVLAPRRPLSFTQTDGEAPSSGSLYKQPPQLSSMEPKPPGVSRVSASLPRSYQRSDSARLTSFVAPRPFGSQSSRITSLPRASTMDNSNKRVNGDVSKKSTVPSRYHQFMTSEDEAQSSSAQSSEEEEEEEEKATAPRSITSTQSISPVPAPIKSEAPISSGPAQEPPKENFCDMRINLNQKPNSSRDFGFQADWDSTGARVTSIQPGSSAEMCQLQAGDEVLTVNGHQVAGMSYTDWKSHMGEALQEGSLVMDIRRHGKNNWDRDQPSLPFKRHKTINLTSTDHPLLLGPPDTNAANKSSLDLTSRISTEAAPPKGTPAEPANGDASHRVNGGFGEEPVTLRNKESEPISLKNLKRRSEFFEQGGSGSSVSAPVYLCGGSETALPDIPVPSITPSSSRWSWDPEEERRRQEKWQKEQERLLQEKYKRDQEKLQEEWLKDQQEVEKSHQEPVSLAVNSHSIGPHSSLSSIREPTPSPWEEEERKRKEELERQRQAEERRKREEEERQLQLLQEERKRKEKQEEEERRRREEEELRWKKKKEEEMEEERRRQEAAEQQRRERQKALEQQWASGSSDSVQAPLSSADRAKSKSSPQLDEEDKPQWKGVRVQPGGMAQWLLEEKLRSARDEQARSQRTASELEMERRNILNAMRYREPERVTAQQPLSQVELERQQILNEMKKKTSLLRDSSWIRQRSSETTANKESDVPPMRRGESLDNLDTSYNSWRSSWTPRSNSYAQSYGRPHSALSGSTSFYGGVSGAQRPGSSTLPSSYSTGSLRGGAGTPSAPWSRQTPPPSLSTPLPSTSPEPPSEAGISQQRSRSVSGKKICTFCDAPLGKGAAMIIESLGLCYHLGCFKCIDCKSDLGGSEAGAEVRIRNKQLYCNNCYMRFKSGQPTVM